jgi:catechol 2,3-dioxygenase-like lactoylglutathione lyase family enzyme
MSNAERPTLNGIVETGLYVEDVERAAQFYERLFGFPRMVSDERFCVFDAGPRCVLLLFRRGGTLEPVTLPNGGVIPPHDGTGELHFAFAMNAADVARWECWLEANQVPVESRVEWTRGGVSLYFRDSDRNLVELASPGIWANY